MDNDPKTRQEKRKNQKQKGRADKLGSSKHIRATEALLQKIRIQGTTRTKKINIFFCSGKI